MRLAHSKLRSLRYCTLHVSAAFGLVAFPVDVALQDGELAVLRGEELGFVIPVKEQLHFEVIVDVPLVGDTGLGRFDIDSRVEVQAPALFSGPAEAGHQKRVGRVTATAGGECLNYKLSHVIDLSILPQAWPHVIYRDTQSGSENRRRELMYGNLQGEPASLFRHDAHCKSKSCKRPEHRVEGVWPLSKEHHCKSCKRGAHRDWRKPTRQVIPASAVDMLSAIFLARSMVVHELDQIEFPMLDKDRCWEVTMVRAKEKQITTRAGRFDCVGIKLIPVLSDEKNAKFKGLFGIHGTLSIWLEKSTGVPVSVEGILPAGPINVGINLLLKRFSGTPEAFRPLP